MTDMDTKKGIRELYNASMYHCLLTNSLVKDLLAFATVKLVIFPFMITKQSDFPF